MNNLPYSRFQHTAARRRLVPHKVYRRYGTQRFNTQPPEGGWPRLHENAEQSTVSTHSRPKAAGATYTRADIDRLFQHTAARRRLGDVHAFRTVLGTVSTHSRPKAAGTELYANTVQHNSVSTHSRPKAAGQQMKAKLFEVLVSTHSRPKAAGSFWFVGLSVSKKFQHTAARRRLGIRAKLSGLPTGFNTQPPEGGWSLS